MKSDVAQEPAVDPRESHPRGGLSSLRGESICLFGLTVLAAAVRLYRLDAKSLWVDEIWRTLWAKGQDTVRFFDVRATDLWATLPLLGPSQALVVTNRHYPPLNSLLLNPWLHLAGADSDFALRLPFALAGALGALGVALWAREVLPFPAALLGGAVIAVSPYHVHLSQEVAHYSTAFAFQAFATVSYVRFLRSPSQRDGAAYAVLTTAALFTHYFCAFVALAQWIALLVERRPRGRAAAALTLPFALPALALAIYLVPNRMQLAEMTHPALMGNQIPLPYFLQQSIKDLAYPWLGVGVERWGIPAVAAVALGVAVLATIGLRSAPPGRRTFLAIHAALPVLLTWAGFWISGKNSLLWPRYQIFFIGAIAVPVCAGIFSLRPGVRALALSVTAGLLVLGLWNYHAKFVKEEWNRAGRTIASLGSAEDAVIVTPTITVYALAHYLPTANLLYGADPEPGYLAQVLEKAAQRPAVWTVFSHWDRTSLGETVRAALARRFPIREDYDVFSISVSRYRRAHEDPGATLPARR